MTHLVLVVKSRRTAFRHVVSRLTALRRAPSRLHRHLGRVEHVLALLLGRHRDAEAPGGPRLGAFRVSSEVTFGRGDLSVCPLGGLIGAQECLVSNLRAVPQGSPQGQTLRALLLRGSCVPH